MNLTKCLLAGLCISAMTASAVLPQENSFETGAFIGDWTAPQGNIVAGITGVSPKPIPAETDTKVLQLDTNGGTWTNTVNASFFGAPLYVDMLVKFVPSEELPQLDVTTKLAIAVTNGLLAVTKINGLGDANVWSSTETAINTSLWYRVTVKIERTGELFFASVTLNGSQQVSVGGETLFGIFDGSYSGALNGLGFSGTGFIDEVVVTDVNPFGSTTVAFGGIGPQVEQQELQIWKDANEITGTEDPNSFDAFVMNVAPEEDGTSPVLFVDSIAVDGDVSVTVQAKYADGTLGPLGDPLNYGAVITVWGKVNLSDGEWVNLGDLLTFDPLTCQFFAVTVGEADVPPGGVIL